MSILLQSKVSEIDLCVHVRSRRDAILPVFIPKRRLSPNSPFSATVVVFGDSVDRALGYTSVAFQPHFCRTLTCPDWQLQSPFSATIVASVDRAKIVAEIGDYSCQCGQATVAVFGVSRRLQRQCGQGFRLYFCRISGHTSVALLPACICGQSSAAIWFLLHYSVKKTNSWT